MPETTHDLDAAVFDAAARHIEQYGLCQDGRAHAGEFGKSAAFTIGAIGVGRYSVYAIRDFYDAERLIGLFKDANAAILNGRCIPEWSDHYATPAHVVDALRRAEKHTLRLADGADS